MKALLALLFLSAWGIHAAETTVIYDEAVSKLESAVPEKEDLWLTTADLTRASRFVLKPKGACLDELCVPITKGRERAFLRRASGTDYFNLAELARVLRQPIARDEPNQVWLFGPRPQARMKVLESLEAPDFTLPDWERTPRSLRDFRGKKVLLITWASW